jgi:HlyD family secretion protein
MPDARTRRLLFWLPWVLATLVALVWLFWPKAVAVDFATAARGPLQVTVSDEGETRVKNVFVVSAPVPGLMRRVALKAGDAVEAGKTVVARIEPSDPSFLDVRSAAESRAAVQAAEAAEKLAVATVERAAAELEFANAELKRYQGLVERKVVSANDFDAAERRARTATAALAEARAALRVRESELTQARARLINPAMAQRRRGADCDCVDVYSPVSGSVLRVLQESEAVVAPGAALVEIGNPQELEIVVDLLSSDAVRVEPGQRVFIEAWGGGERLNGTVRRVEPFGFTKVSALGIEEQRVNVIIAFSDPPERWRRLGHGYRVEPRIILAEGDNVLKVPRSALFRDGNQWAVFVDDEGKATLRQIELGLENGLEAEIRTGLNEGERVVLQPSDRVSDGVRVTERRS